MRSNFLCPLRAKYQELDTAKKKWLAANGGSTENWDDLSQEEKKTRIQNKSGELMGTGTRDQHRTRNDSIKRAWGNIKDLGNQMVGNYQDHSGFLEKDENGKPAGFKDRTCFVAGTKVKTKDGYVDIETIQAGDLVASANQYTGVVSWKPVKETYIRKALRIYKLTYNNGTTVETTGDHPFFIEGKGWTNADSIFTGDISPTWKTLENRGGIENKEVVQSRFTRCFSIECK